MEDKDSNKMNKERITRILRKYKDIFDALEKYDETGKLPFQRKRIDLTLSVETLNKLNKLKQKTGKPVSRLIEEKFN